MSSFEQKIGFDRIRDQIRALCTTQGGREKLAAQGFSTSIDQVGRRLALADQLRDILLMGSGFPTGEYVDLAPIVAKAAVEGAFLEPEEWMTLRTGLDLAGQIKRFLSEKSASELRALTENLADFAPLIKSIDGVFDRLGQIKDSASPELRELRQAIRQSEGLAEKRLRAVLAKAQADGVVEADAALSMREGRPVIPVSAANKRKLNGFVLGESATGKTLFVEPVEVVEINNRLRELEFAQRREVIRILSELTAALGPDLPAIDHAGELLTTLDMIRAKARWAIDNGAVRPILSREGVLELRQARHPLLAQTLGKEGREIVPLDLKLDRQKRILLISGPNAGGKSVCLKTVGILQWMTQCGFLIPALENSELPIFESLFIDIGDQQSIDNDLSTYSSHLLNMKQMLASTTERSLVLIDEMGTGTEPVIGGAIAEAILERLEERGCMGVITTHYANLKYYAANASGVINGAMRFDVQHIQPLFSLEMGTPGSSFAVEIARKIGLPEAIIARAAEKAGSDQLKVETLLRQAARDKRYWEQKRDKIRLAEKRVEQLEEKYADALSKTSDERRRILASAKQQAEDLTLKANRQIENTIREIRESQADKVRTRAARQQLQTLKEELAAPDEPPPTPLRARKKAAPSAAPATTIEVGSKVRIVGQQTPGEVLSVKGKKAEVAFGQIRTKVELSRLEPVSGGEFRQLTRHAHVSIRLSEDIAQRRLNFKQSIDLRGMRAAEAIEAVEAFIDDAVMAGGSELRILHGKGTGALKEEIRRYLKALPEVAGAEDEHVERGGAGITIVKLRS